MTNNDINEMTIAAAFAATEYADATSNATRAADFIASLRDILADDDSTIAELDARIATDDDLLSSFAETAIDDARDNFLDNFIFLFSNPTEIDDELADELDNMLRDSELILEMTTRAYRAALTHIAFMRANSPDFDAEMRAALNDDDAARFES